MRIRFTILGYEVWSLEVELFSLEITEDEDELPTTDCSIGGGPTHNFERDIPAPEYDWGEGEYDGRKFGFC